MSWTGPTTDAEALLFLSPSLQQRWSWSWGCKNHLTLSPFRGPPPPLSLSPLSPSDCAQLLSLHPFSYCIHLLTAPRTDTQNQFLKVLDVAWLRYSSGFWTICGWRLKQRRKVFFQFRCRERTVRPLHRPQHPSDSSASSASLRGRPEENITDRAANENQARFKRAVTGQTESPSAVFF